MMPIMHDDQALLPTTDSKENALVSLVIPIYNEAQCLSQNVLLLEDYLNARGTDYELILVDDGSSDASGKIGRQIVTHNHRIHLSSHVVNRGKGYAVRTGMLRAQGAYRIFMDADLAVPVSYIGECIDVLKQGADVVIGSRHLPGACSKIQEETLRRALGGIYRRLVLSSFGLTVSDITCGLKGFRAAATDLVFTRSRIDRWGYDAEILFLAQKLDMVIREIPVHWYHSFDSDVHILKDSIRTFAEMVQIYLQYIAGRYRLPRQ